MSQIPYQALQEEQESEQLAIGFLMGQYAALAKGKGDIKSYEFTQIINTHITISYEHCDIRVDVEQIRRSIKLLRARGIS